jgi:carbon-monoxide dehydrogenase small subunit
MTDVTMTVNGDERKFTALGPESLLTVLREEFGLTGSKNACEQGECGSCSVLMDGNLVCSCLVMAVDADGSVIGTVEGLAEAGGQLNPVQAALVEHGGVQCGFCTPGFVVAATKLLSDAQQSGATLDEHDIREGLAGNLCRCTGYGAILRAVSSIAAQQTASP